MYLGHLAAWIAGMNVAGHPRSDREAVGVCCSEQYGSELAAATNGLTYEQHVDGLSEPPRATYASASDPIVPPPPPASGTVVTEREPETLIEALRQLWRRFIG